MDDNTRQVLIAAVGVVGTLAGIALGWILQSLRRHDEAKRVAFARYVGIGRAVINLTQTAIENGEVDAGVDPVARELWECYGMIRMLGRRSTWAAAKAFHEAVSAWFDADRDKGDVPAARLSANRALEAFIDAARQELG